MYKNASYTVWKRFGIVLYTDAEYFIYLSSWRPRIVRDQTGLK